MIFPPSKKFQLEKSFIEQYKNKQPNWSDLAYITYKRTYARLIESENRTEDWWETVKRIVEGVYTIQKTHCFTLNLPWVSYKAQASAQEMFRLIWDFKFLPPGRGLWMMGTDVVYLRGGSALNNCAFVSTDEINTNFAEPFCFLMDMSMFGVGVAFDTKGAGKVTIKQPIESNQEHIVEDTKEGWVEIIRVILDSYLGKNKFPINVDYSQIRPAGSPIKTFGGIAPGPEPLKLCVKEVTEILNTRIGYKITASDIVDLMNIIGKCVVSGGVRRTAELALGDPSDEEFLNLKDPTLNQEYLNRWRWASNNTVSVSVGEDYSNLGAQTAKNGEPGYFWLDNARSYGRLIDGVNNIDHKVMGTNPCVTGDTLILCADGSGHKRIDEIKDGTPVYCLNNEGEVTIKRMLHPRITGYNQKIYKLTLDDGMTIRCTGNHKFLTRDGEYRELTNLRVGDSLAVMTKYIPDKFVDLKNGSRFYKYIGYELNGEKSYYEHEEIAKYKFNISDLSGKHVHHIDENKLNNYADNLDIMSQEDHLSYHSKGLKNGNSYNVSNEDLLSIGVNLCKKLGRRFSSNEWEKYAEENNLPKSFTEYRENDLGKTALEFSRKCADLAEIKLPDLDPRTLRFYLELLETGYDAFIEGKTVYVRKICEFCGKEFEINALQREVGMCSHQCNIMYIAGNKEIRDKARNTQLKTFEEKRNILKEKQIKIYIDLKVELGRLPLKKELILRCKDSKISAELGRKGSPFKSYDEMHQYAEMYNHRIVSIEEDGYADVWNGTVDEHHNFFLGGHSSLTRSGVNKLCYLNSTNCGEQSLENFELCCLVETFPAKHESFEEYKRTLKYAYLYAKTVTLIPTHFPRTNQIMLRNRRIGLSMSGITTSFEKFGRRNFLNMCLEGYDYITELDELYSDWLCIPISKKRTSVKPSGTVSILAGEVPGIHYPHSEHYNRTIRINVNNPLIKILEEANYRIEDSVSEDNSKVVYFPIKEPYFKRSKTDVSIWEQVMNVIELQRVWSDNQVSVTVTFNKNEAKDIPYLLELAEVYLKSISFLPLVDHNYPQAPYQEITKEEYYAYKKTLKPLNINSEKTSDIHDVTDSFCDSDGKCDLNAKLNSNKVSDVIKQQEVSGDTINVQTI